MFTCRIILEGDLADLAGGRREVVRRLPAATSIRDAVEAVGIPHVEMGRVAIDGRDAALGDLVDTDTEMTVHPTLPHDLADPRFVCDLHLGKLARLLRFCGFDTLWDRAWREPRLARMSLQEGRTVLSRHRALLKRSAVTSGLLVRSNQADEQLTEVLRRFRLGGRVTSPGRCATCNGRLAATRKADVPVPIPPRTAAWLDDYWLCEGCGQLFWEGTHVTRLRERVARAVAAAGS